MYKDKYMHKSAEGQSTCNYNDAFFKDFGKSIKYLDPLQIVFCTEGASCALLNCF